MVIGKGDGAHNFCMRVFEISPEGHTPRHSHDWEHEMFIHSGEGEVYGNGRWNPMASGNVVFIPGNEEHQMRNTGKELLVVVCLVPGPPPSYKKFWRVELELNLPFYSSPNGNGGGGLGEVF